MCEIYGQRNIVFSEVASVLAKKFFPKMGCNFTCTLYTKTFTRKKIYPLHYQVKREFAKTNRGFFFQEEECEIFSRHRKLTICEDPNGAKKILGKSLRILQTALI